MKRTIVLLTIIIALLISSAVAEINTSNPNNILDNSSSKGFIENKGQITYPDGKSANEIKYVFAGNGFKLQIKNNSFSYEFFKYEENENRNKQAAIQNTQGLDIAEGYSIKSHRVDVAVVNSNPNPKIFAEGASEEYYNYYLNLENGKGSNEKGNDGILGVRKYEKVRIEDIYPGIDIVFYISGDKITKKIKYDFIVKPGAQVSAIKLEYQGADNLRITEDGALEIKTSLGTLKENIPVSYYQDYSGQRTENGGQGTEKQDVKYKLTGNTLSFVPVNDKSDKTLTIDPELFWGTYYGGEDYDFFYDVGVDSKDFFYATGNTQSVANIATSGAFQTTYAGNRDAVLAKFNNQGRLVWASYFGGSETDYGQMVVINRQDSVIVAGYTYSQSGLTTAASYQPVFGGGPSDGFIAKFNSNGQRLWCSYYGGSEYDAVYGLSQDSSYNIFICGKTQSQDGISTSDGFQNYKEDVIDGFLVKFDSTMNRVWGTYFGGPEGSGNDVATSVAADRIGNVFITGYTPCTYSIANNKGFQQTYGGGNYDAFIAKFYPSGSLHWSSYYGGSDEDLGRSVATFGNGNVYLMGSTKSFNNISSTNGFQQTLGGLWDSFIVKFDTYGDRKWGTYYGGSDDDLSTKISKYGFDELLALGYTKSTNNIATAGEVQTVPGGLEDAYIVRFNTNGSRQWGTYYGGDQAERLDYAGISFDKKGNIIIAGSTESAINISTPSTNPHQPVFDGDTLWAEYPRGSGTWVITGFKDDAFMAMLGTRITIGSSFENQYCIGETITVPFTVGLDFNNDNVYTLQLSDDTGGFANPVNIGTLNGYTSANISGVIPMNTSPGTGYRIRISASSPSNISVNNGFNITVSPLPTPSITGSTPVCSRNTYYYTVTSGVGAQNKWYITNGTIIGDSTAPVVRIKWQDFPTGNLKVVQLNPSTGCIDSTEKDVEIDFAPQPLITGEQTVTSYSTENYSTTPQSILNYEWIISGGTIQGLSNTNRIVVQWGGPGVGTVRLKLTDTRTDCSDTMLVSVIINSSPLLIQGRKTVCANSEEKYSVITESTRKNLWTATGGAIQGVETDSTVKIIWGIAGEGFIQLIQTDTVSQVIDTVVQRVEIIAQPDVSYIGTDEVCEGLPEIYFAVITDNRTNKWTVYNGEITGSDTAGSVTIHWADIADDEDSIYVKASLSLEQTDLTTGCSNIKSSIVSISKNPSAKFIGSSSVCSGRVENYTVVDKKVLINEWSITGGTIIGSAEDSSLTVEWGEPGAGTIRLFQTGLSLCSDSSLTNIVINIVPDRPTISQSGKVLISSAEEGNQWYYNGELIAGAVNKLFMPDKSGYFTVQVTNSKDCSSDMSQPYNFDINRVSDGTLAKLGIKVYPNPTENMIYIDFGTSEFLKSSLNLLNSIGQTLWSDENNNSHSETLIKIGMDSYPSGMYILEVRFGNKIYHEKIVKQ